MHGRLFLLAASVVALLSMARPAHAGCMRVGPNGDYYDNLPENCGQQRNAPQVTQRWSAIAMSPSTL